MKTKLTLLLLIVVNLFLNSGCEKNQFSSQKPDPSRYKECSIGMSPEEVKKIIGYPDKIYSGNGTGIQHQKMRWFYDGIARFTVWFEKGYVYRITPLSY
jgi:hypothetical protein